MESSKELTGFLITDGDWTGLDGKHYTCPGKFEENIMYPEAGKSGMHFFLKADACYPYIEPDKKYRIAEVKAYGDIDIDWSKRICATNRLEVIREITMYALLEQANKGCGNTGLKNAGDWNSGDNNYGDCNAGNYNNGGANTGDWNDGIRNAGDWNTGDWNTGSHNPGSRNTGSYNDGNGNTGSCNLGNRNTGDWNLCSHSTGCFNTEEQPIFLFDHISSWTYEDWRKSEAARLMAELKDALWGNKVPDANGWWRDLTKKQKDTIRAIPNFDVDIFKRITGIDAEM